MSFEMMKLTDLRKVADSFGIELDQKSSKNTIMAALEEEGITYDMYEKFSGADKQELENNAEVKQPKQKLTKENTILVRMDRSNPSFSVGRFVFTQEHPFVAMSENDAQRIFDTQAGFRPATPREVAEFYG